MHGADSLLGRLARRQPVTERVALVVAHPDDETIGAGAVLPLFRHLVLVHVTDGAPRSLTDAHAHGFSDAASYAAARRRELSEALSLTEYPEPDSRMGCPSASHRDHTNDDGMPKRIPSYAVNGSIHGVALRAADQEASSQLVPLTHALRAVLAEHGVTAILTHPYEGGHPDHDAAAFIAAHAGPPVYEFASYHAAPDGGIRTSIFLPGLEPVRLVLTPEEQARKRAMLAAFTTQAATLAPFGTEAELFRRAPRYDFAQPPHGGALHYERYDWGMTGPRWRTLAAEAQRALC